MHSGHQGLWRGGVYVFGVYTHIANAVVGGVGSTLQGFKLHPCVGFRPLFVLCLAILLSMVPFQAGIAFRGSGLVVQHQVPTIYVRGVSLMATLIAPLPLSLGVPVYVAQELRPRRA